jgi:hypothetical protein
MNSLFTIIISSLSLSLASSITAQPRATTPTPTAWSAAGVV